MININADNGLGRVIEKNNFLHSSGSEKVTATFASDNNSFWIISAQTNRSPRGIYCYKLDENGLNETPVISNIGSLQVDRGYMKVSPFGDLLAVAWQNIDNRPTLELFSFDNGSGMVTDTVLISKDILTRGSGPYGLEFSPNGSFLYVTERTAYNRPITSNRIFQFDISTLNSDSIQQSATILDDVTDHQVGALQVASNGKIYVAFHDSDSLGVIEFPDRKGLASGYRKNGIYLSGRKSLQGLPTFNQSLFRKTEMLSQNFCLGDSTNFSFETDIANIDSLRWQFAAFGESIELSPSFVFPSAGNHRVSLTIYFEGRQIELNEEVTINETPQIELGEDMVRKSLEQFHLSIPQDYPIILWNTGATETSILTDQAGTYAVYIENEFGCSRSDTIRLDTLDIMLSNECLGDPVQLSFNTSIDYDSLIWSLTDTMFTIENPTILFDEHGQKAISLELFYHGNAATLDTSLLIYDVPIVDLGNDTTLFFKETLLLNVNKAGTTYTWQDASNSSTFEVFEPGTYWVEATNEFGCTSTDTIQVKYDQLIDVSLGNDTTICADTSIELDLFQEGLTYQWSTGETTPSIIVSDSAEIWVTITNSYRNRTKQDTIRISRKFFDPVTVNDTLICESDNVLLQAMGANSDEFYKWFNAQGDFIERNDGQFETPLITESTNFSVSLSDGVCESDPKDVAIIYEPPVARILNTDTIMILGETIELLGEGGSSYEWTPTTFLSDPAIQNPIAASPDNITYTLKVTDENGCTDQTSINLIVLLELVYNNTFTPNGDGQNDLWIIQNLDRFPANKVTIFDRNGNKLNEFMNYQNDWDGTFNGISLPSGVYYFIIETNREPIKGFITILR